MAIALADIKKLRDMTSAGMMDCKKALEEAEGDFKRAVEILREKGKSTLAKRGDNETTQGAVLSRVNGGKAVLVCLGCETDFVAATPDFKKLAGEIADAAITAFPAVPASVLPSGLPVLPAYSLLAFQDVAAAGPRLRQC